MFFCLWTSAALRQGLILLATPTLHQFSLRPLDSDWIISLAFLILLLDHGTFQPLSPCEPIPELINKQINLSNCLYFFGERWLIQSSSSYLVQTFPNSFPKLWNLFQNSSNIRAKEKEGLRSLRTVLAILPIMALARWNKLMYLLVNHFYE